MSRESTPNTANSETTEAPMPDATQESDGTLQGVVESTNSLVGLLRTLVHLFIALALGYTLGQRNSTGSQDGSELLSTMKRSLDSISSNLRDDENIPSTVALAVATNSQRLETSLLSELAKSFKDISDSISGQTNTLERVYNKTADMVRNADWLPVSNYQREAEIRDLKSAIHSLTLQNLAISNTLRTNLITVNTSLQSNNWLSESNRLRLDMIEQSKKPVVGLRIPGVINVGLGQ